MDNCRVADPVGANPDMEATFKKKTRSDCKDKKNPDPEPITEKLHIISTPR